MRRGARGAGAPDDAKIQRRMGQFFLRGRGRARTVKLLELLGLLPPPPYSCPRPLAPPRVVS